MNPPSSFFTRCKVQLDWKTLTARSSTLLLQDEESSILALQKMKPGFFINPGLHIVVQSVN